MEWAPYIFSQSVLSFTLLILNTWILFIPHIKHIRLFPNPHLGFLSSSISEISEWSTGTSIRTKYSSEWISSLWLKGKSIYCTHLKHTHAHTHTVLNGRGKKRINSVNSFWKREKQGFPVAQCQWHSSLCLLPMQETWVLYLIREDLTCHRST